jgi:phosphopantothenoylcysteine decarboxylase/phosphopantothenate--cysteine ligase
VSRSDLDVASFSDALAGRHLDVVVTGSIGAVESVRFVRSLRRIGSDVTVWLTRGAQQFVTETALAWASARPVTQSFSGTASHIALNDGCVIAPATANLISKVAQGITDSPATALAASYLGQKKPVILVPNMHDSLIESPFVAQNLERLRNYCQVLAPRQEEGKQKFPEPRELADRVSHELNHTSQHQGVLISMGTTRGYFDDIRYISNYSSGALGSCIAEELYRWGFPTYVVAGPANVYPQAYTQRNRIETNDQLAQACQNVLSQYADSAILAASVLDFVPTEVKTGKISSKDDFAPQFKKTPKIIDDLHPSSGVKIGFKLGTDMTEECALDIAKDYAQRNNLSMMILNNRRDVDQSRHRAFLIEYPQQANQCRTVEGKQAIARGITQHLQNAKQLPTMIP